MHARAVDDARIRLRELRCEEWEDLGVGVAALGLALVATQLRPALAVPLFLGGIVVLARAVRALWRRWDLVDQLAGERDAYVIPEVLAVANREATFDRRHGSAVALRSLLLEAGPILEARVRAARADLDALAIELDDEGLELDPASAVACVRLLRDIDGPLLGSTSPPEELRSRVRQIRAGFTPRRIAA